MELDFYYACWEGNLTLAENLIMQNVNINWQNPNERMFTPLMMACFKDQINIVKLLLKQKSIDINLQDTEGYTALFCGYIESIKILIASGCNLNATQKTNDKESDSKYCNKTASEITKIGGHNKCAELVESYVNNPKQIIDELRKELNWTTHEAELLALTIFLSDGLLKLNDDIEL